MPPRSIFRPSRSAVAAATLLSLVAVGLSVPAHTLAAVATPTSKTTAKPATAPGDPVSSALEEAKSTGRPAALAAETGVASTVVVNPDGTFTQTVSSNPQRVRQNGSWVPIDTSLVRLSDGSFGPKAATADVSFSAGGDTALASLRDDRHKLAFTWPGKLPAATVTGDTLTYPEVLPDVDLQVTADAAGYSSMLVVKTAKAAADPRLQTVEFGLKADNLTLAGTSAGGAEATDPVTHATVFHSDTALMWDSSPAQDTPAHPAPTSLADPLAEHTAAAAMGAHRAQIKVGITASTQTLTLDKALLTAKTTKFPVFVDPQWSGSPGKSQLNWARISSNGWNVYNSTATSGANSARIGYDDWPETGGAGEKARTYYQMNTSGIKGAVVSSAHLYVTERWAASCSDTAAAVYGTAATGGWGSSTLYWGHEPSRTSVIDTASSHEADCGTSGVHVTPAKLDFNITSRIKPAAKEKWASAYFVVEAKDMSDKYSWKQLDYGGGATLSVTYSYPPKLMDGDGNPSVHPSMIDQGRTLTTISTPTLSARAINPDLAGGSESVMVSYHVYNSSGAQMAYGYGPKTGYNTNGSDWQTPALQDGTYTWKVTAKNSSGLWMSGWGPTQTFTIDTKLPTAPQVNSPDFPPQQIGTAFDSKGRFVLANDHTDDVTGYLFSLDGNLANVVYTSTKGTAWTASTAIKTGTVYFAKADNADGTGTAVTNGSAGISFAPGTVGAHTLYVKAVDKAGSSSGQTSYLFYAGSSVPVIAYGDKMVSGYTATNTDGTTTTVPAATAVSTGGHVISQASSAGNYYADGFQGMLANNSTTSVANGDKATFSFNVPKAGSWDIGANLTVAKDYAAYSLTLDAGRANATSLITDLDMYGAVTTTRYINFGIVKNTDDTAQTLSQGVHTLTLTITGKNAASTGYQAGIDVLRISPTPTCAINNTTSCLNNTATSTYTAGTPATVTSADADGDGDSLNSADLTAMGWTAGATVTIDGAAVKLPAAFGTGANDNMLGSGQLITVPTTGVTNQGNALVFLGFATNGAIQNATGTITYAQNTCLRSQTYAIDALPDWTSGTANSAVVTLPHRNKKDATQTTSVTPRLFAVSVPLLCPGVAVTSISLPVVSNGVQTGRSAFHVLGMGIRPTSISTSGASAVHWVGTWAAAHDTAAVQSQPSGGTATNATLNNQTLRFLAHVSLGTGSLSGSRIRVHLSNQLGTSPVTFDAASVALQDTTAFGATAAATPVPLTFNGGRPATIAAGTDLLSDPVTLAVPQRSNLLVSLKVHGSLTTLAGHLDARSPVYITVADNIDHTGDVAATSFSTSTITGTPFLSAIDVSTSATEPAGAVVLYGDQTVNGDTASRDGMSQLSDRIADAYIDDPDGDGTMPVGILNEGSSSWNSRFPLPSVAGTLKPLSAGGLVDRQILAQANARTILLSSGSVDLLSCTGTADACASTVKNKLAALAWQIRQYPADDKFNFNVALPNSTRSLAVYVATIPAFTGTHTAAQESARGLVNTYILGSSGQTYLGGNADGAIDFAAAVSADGTTNATTIKAADLTVSGTTSYPNDLYYQDLARQYVTDAAPVGSGDNGPGAYDPVAVWKLDAGTGTTANDTGAGTGDLAVTHPATLHNATWGDSRMVGGRAATFNGTSSYASTDLTVDTTKSFSVSAWVQLSDKSADRTIFSRDSGGNPSFILQYQKSTDQFVARMPNHATGDDTYWFDAESYSSPEIGVWYHLAAVYDAEQATLTLYANGEPIGGASEVAAFNDPDGATWIGRGLDSWFAGNIADVQVWQRPIDPGDVVALSGPVQVADWEFDDGSGDTATDFSDYGHLGQVTRGATWTTSGHLDTDPGALTFNGIDGTVTTNQLLRTDQSYTVSAWARLTSKAGYATVAGQDGTHSSAFQLAYDMGWDCWAWELSATNTVDPDQSVICQPGTAVLNTWVHLVGVYNAATGIATLYINGSPIASDVGPAQPWNATGPTTVGRSRWEDHDSDHFPGDIDAVHIYQGVLSDDQIQNLAAL